MRLIPIGAVREDSELAKTLYDSNGRVLLSKGVILGKKLIKRIKATGIMSIYINDEYSQNEIEEVIKPQLRQKAIQNVKDSFGKVEYISDMENSNKKKVAKMKNEYAENINNLVNDLVDEIFYQKDIMVKIVDIKSMDNYTYEHCVNVAVLSLITGIEMKLNKEKLTHLAAGAILHDLGKTFVPEDILSKKGKLDNKEFEIMKNHSKQGYEFLKENMFISSLSRIISLQHHERVDGTGYPLGLKDKTINDFAKIVAIADVYDALTSDRPYRGAMSPSEAVEYIMGASGTHFDYEVAKAFVKRIVPYPEGTLVKLSNGDIGVVEETNELFILRPKIHIIKRDGRKVEDLYLELMDEKSITITDVVHNIED